MRKSSGSLRLGRARVGATLAPTARSKLRIVPIWCQTDRAKGPQDPRGERLAALHVPLVVPAGKEARRGQYGARALHRRRRSSHLRGGGRRRGSLRPSPPVHDLLQLQHGLHRHVTVSAGLRVPPSLQRVDAQQGRHGPRGRRGRPVLSPPLDVLGDSKAKWKGVQRRRQGSRRGRDTPYLLEAEKAGSPPGFY